MKLIGLKQKDVKDYSLTTHPFTENDFAIGKSLMRAKFFTATENKQYLAELQGLMKNQFKAEIQSFFELGIQYLAHRYLPEAILKREYF
jgi:DNA topoisomerase VI subunit A